MKTLVQNWLAEFNIYAAEETAAKVANYMKQAQEGTAPKSAISRVVWELVSSSYGLAVVEDGQQVAETKKILLGVTRIGNYHSSEQNMRNCYNAWAQPELYTSGGRRGGSSAPRTRRTAAQAVAPAVAAEPVPVAPTVEDDARLAAAWEVFKASVAPLMLDESSMREYLKKKDVEKLEADLPYTFGVEIECAMQEANIERFISVCRAKGLNVYNVGHYAHSGGARWEIKTDSSVTAANIGGGYVNREIASPVLKGAKGLKELKTLLSALDGCGARVNSSCGLHVHIGINEFTAQQVKNVVLTFANAEHVMTRCSWKSRVKISSSSWCEPVARYAPALRSFALQGMTNPVEVAKSICYNVYQHTNKGPKRYHDVNLESAYERPTIEFRQHQGTCDYKKIRNWVFMLEKMCKWCKDECLENPRSVGTFADLPWCDEKLAQYYEDRQVWNEIR